LEVAIGTLLLKMSPDDIVHNMKAEYWQGTDDNGVESVERIYTNWCSGKYAVDIENLIRNGLETDRVPLILYCSLFVDGGVMGSNRRSATPVSMAIQNVRKAKFQSLLGFVPDDHVVSSEVLEGLLESKGINKSSRKFILQSTDRQREYDYLHAMITPFMDRQEQANGFDVQIGTGVKKKYYRVYVVFTNFLADSPQMHRLTGVSNSACHLCMCRNFADFRINDCDVHGRNGSICEKDIPRDLKKQYDAGRLHMKVMASFINKEEDSNTRPAQAERKKAKELLKELNGYSGTNKVFSIFKLLIEEGIGTMIRLFGSDLLHTWTLGFVEACVGFSLQIIKFIGHHNVDSTFSQNAKILLEIIKEFPAYNSLQPSKRHTSFSDIWELMQTTSSQEATNPMNTTGILKMRESFKLFSAMLQIYFALADNRLLPCDDKWSRIMGFSEPYFNPRHVLVNALNAVIEVHWYFKAGSLTETQLQTLQMLIANAQAHMLVLDVMRKRIINKATTSKEKFVDQKVGAIGLMNNLKSELISHMVEAMRQSGCDNNARDTELGEMLMKSCKVLFTDTNRRYSTVLKDMLIKYMHLQYMAIAKKGFEDNNLSTVIPKQDKKSHNSSDKIIRSEHFEYRTNNCYKKQVIKFHGMAYRPKKVSEDWNVHAMLKLVSSYKQFQSQIAYHLNNMLFY